MPSTDSEPSADTASPRRRRDAGSGTASLPAMYMRFFGLTQQPFSLAPVLDAARALAAQGMRARAVPLAAVAAA